jgi:transaldolase
MTSNPAIFEKAIAESNLYDTDIKKLHREGKDISSIYEVLSQADVQSAADVFRALYEKTSGKDGYVSLEVNPHLANDTEGTVAEGKRLWLLLNRPNVFIKVPATPEGLDAIRQLIADGININVTLLFSVERYREVANAYIDGLESRLSHGEPIDQTASVASFFVSRIDSLIDPQLEKIIESPGNLNEPATEALGEVAVSSAKVAYQIYKEIFSSVRFKKLEAKGAQAQRLLWASTSSKNPAYSDVKYIEALIGENTVNTVPPQTIDAYRDHGNPQLTIEEDLDKAKRVLNSLPTLGIDLNRIAQQLEDEGVKKFNEPFDKLMQALAQKSGH